MSEKKTSKNIWLHIMGVLILLVTISRLCTIGENTLQGILMIASLVLTALYGFFLYKKPHGNMLKFAMLLFSFTGILSNCIYLAYAPVAYDYAIILGYTVLFYVAGRLNRIEQNRFILPVLLVMLIIKSVILVNAFHPETFVGFLSNFCQPITLLTLCCAYFTRYQEHKEAGLQDAPKK